MSSGGNQFYPYWLGSPPSVIPNNQIQVNGNTANAVPRILISTAVTPGMIDTNPVEVYTLSNVDKGKYISYFTGICAHAPGSNWQPNDTVQFGVKINNLSNTSALVQVRPNYNHDQYVNEECFIAGTALMDVTSNNSYLDWTVFWDPQTAGNNTGYYGGFGFITLQKIA